jgi:hypothetical protein
VPRSEREGGGLLGEIKVMLGAGSGWHGSRHAWLRLVICAAAAAAAAVSAKWVWIVGPCYNSCFVSGIKESSRYVY